MSLARRYNGLAILWEHRFYGDSLPFNLDVETGAASAGYDAYKYLTNEQVSYHTILFHPLLNRLDSVDIILFRKSSLTVL